PSSMAGCRPPGAATPSPPMSWRTPICRSGGAPASSIPPIPPRSPGWWRSPAGWRSIPHAPRLPPPPPPSAADGEPEVIDDNEGPGAVPRHQLTDALKRLLTCIGRLAPDRQRMLSLAYFGAFTREQLAAKLDMPVDALRSALRRNLGEVEQCLKS